MAESDGATTGVDLCMVETENVQAVDGHGGKCLVDLKDVDVFFRELELL
jgi:hypothetical protein